MYVESRKIVHMNLISGQAERQRRREWTCGWDMRWGEEEGKNWEIRIDMYTLPCVKQIVGGKLLYPRELSQVLCNDLRSGMRGWDRDSRGRGYTYAYGGFICCTAEANTAL